MTLWSLVAASSPEHVESHSGVAVVFILRLVEVFGIFSLFGLVRSVGGKLTMAARSLFLYCAHLSGYRRDYHIDV